jgi:hypothetical protein
MDQESGKELSFVWTFYLRSRGRPNAIPDPKYIATEWLLVEYFRGTKQAKVR